MAAAGLLGCVDLQQGILKSISAIHGENPCAVKVMVLRNVSSVVSMDLQCQDAFLKANGLGAVHDAMRRHPQDPQLLAHACITVMLIVLVCRCCCCC